MSALLRAVDHPRRREILRLVWAQERAAGEIHQAMGSITFGATSQHLRVLREAGVVQRRRDGRQQLYLANQTALEPFRAWLEDMWTSALYRLKVEAELETARRGPRPRKGRRT